jgi:hypothetical protein
MRSLFSPRFLTKSIPRVLAASALVLWQQVPDSVGACSTPVDILECQNPPKETCVALENQSHGYLYCAGGYYCGDTNCHCVGSPVCHQ